MAANAISANNNIIIKMPPTPTYGAIELKEFIARNTWRGFIYACSILVLLFLFYGLYGILTAEEAKKQITAPVANRIALEAPPAEEENKNEEVAPPVDQVVNYGIDVRAGTPVPIPDAELKADIADFASMENIEKAMSTTGDVDISKLSDFNIEEASQKTFVKEEIPPEDEFIAVEKDPIVDLAEIQKRIVYPEMAKKAGVEGTVTVRVFIDKSGKVQKTKISDSPSPMLENAALDAVKKGTYTPGIQNGQPIGCWVSIPIRFILKNK